MLDEDAKFVGSVPENYDRFLGPVLFQPYAIDLASRVNSNNSGRILELACGTGILTAALSQQLPAGSKLVATDFNEPMLSYARRKFISSDVINWLVADATSLPFVEGTFNAIFCQFGLMFVPDKLGALMCIRSLLRPRGEFLFNVWDKLDHNSFQRIAHETLLRLFPVNPPMFYQVPFTMWDQEKLRALLTEAGFCEVTMETIEKPAAIGSAHDLAVGLVFGNPLIAGITDRGSLPPEVVVEEVEQAIADEYSGEFANGDMRAIVITAKSSE